MKIQIESTEQITLIDNVQCRVWKGTTESGTECLLFVRRIAVSEEQDQSQFAQELQEQLPPGRIVPLQMVM